MYTTGRRQPVNPTPANAKLEAMSFTKFRRETPSGDSLSPSRNSRSSHSRNSGVSATSSRLRQYFGPVSGYGQVGGIVLLILYSLPVTSRAGLRWMHIPMVH